MDVGKSGEYTGAARLKKARKIETKIRPPEKMKAYLDAARDRDVLPMFYMELTSGLRKGEIAALLWSDPDEENRTISVTKQYIRNPDGIRALTEPKTETSIRQVRHITADGAHGEDAHQHDPSAPKVDAFMLRVCPDLPSKYCEATPSFWGGLHLD